MQEDRMSTAQERERFGQRLRALMKIRGLTQSELARRTGIDRTQLNRIINDKASPKPHEIAWLAQYLGLSSEEMLAGVEASSDVRRAIDESRAAIQRVVDAEVQRDEALALAAEANDLLVRERHERERERQQAEAALREAVEHWQARVHEQEWRAVSERNEHAVENANLKSLLRQAAQGIEHLQSTERTLRAQLATAKKQLADIRANKAAGQLFAGLAGAVIGRAID